KHVTGNPVRLAWKQHRAALGRIQAKRDAISKPWTHLSGDEQRTLLTVDGASEAHRLMMAFAIFVGLREGEQFNLELRAIHVDDDEPPGFVRWGGKGEPPKNGKTRTVPLSPDALVVTKRWLDVLPAYLGDHKNEHKLAFPTVHGHRVQPGKTPL